MKIAACAVGLAVTAALTGGVLTGCGSNKSSSPSSSASSSSAATTSSTPTSATAAAPPKVSPAASPTMGPPGDYTNLLIKPTDIGPDFSSPQQPVSNPHGVPGAAQVFINGDGNRRLGDAILVFADPASAAAGYQKAKGLIGNQVTGTPQPIDVGSDGQIIVGTAADNSKAQTIIMFTEGNALVNLEFDSLPNDPTPPDFALGIAGKQDAAIKAGLPG